MYITTSQMAVFPQTQSTTDPTPWMATEAIF